MDKIINYIISIYGGGRRCYQNKFKKYSPINIFVEEHINFLKTNPLHIKYATFVFNESKNPDTDLLIEKINKFSEETQLNVTILTRPNIDYSYGAWEHALEYFIGNTEITHNFLIEDDYIPQCKDFLNYFLENENENTKYVATLWKNNHAAMSSGLINQNKIQNLYNTTKKIFKLKSKTPEEKYKNTYSDGQWNQRWFLDFLEGEGEDVSKISSNGYLEPKHLLIKYFGTKNKPTIINPIVIK